jgi:hypothetical protein
MRKKLSIIILTFFIFSCSKKDTTTQNVEKFNVVIKSNEGGTVSSTGGSFEKGSTFSVTATPSKDYDFLKWMPGNVTENPLKLIINSDINVEAFFQPKDDDKDGIYNINDECSNTSIDSLVSYKGCYPKDFLEVLKYNVLVSAGFNVLFDYKENDFINSIKTRYYSRNNESYIDAPLNSELLYYKNLKQTKIIKKTFSEVVFEVSYDDFVEGKLVRNIVDTIQTFWGENYPFVKPSVLIATSSILNPEIKSNSSRSYNGITVGDNYLKEISKKRRDKMISQTESEFQTRILSPTSKAFSKTKLNDNEYFFSEYFQDSYYKYQEENGTLFLLHMFPFNENQYELYIVENNCALKFTNSELKNIKRTGIENIRWNPGTKIPDQYNVTKNFASFSLDNRLFIYNGNYEPNKINETPIIISNKINSTAGINKLMTKISSVDFQNLVSGMTICK